MLNPKKNGNYLVVGSASSNDGDVKENKGSLDYWVFEVASGVQDIKSDISDNVFSIFTPLADAEDIDMGDVEVGVSKDSLIVPFLINNDKSQ